MEIALCTILSIWLIVVALPLFSIATSARKLSDAIEEERKKRGNY